MPVWRLVTDEYKQAVIDAIAGGTIDGITGTFTFDEHHNPVKQTAILTYGRCNPRSEGNVLILLLIPHRCGHKGSTQK